MSEYRSALRAARERIERLEAALPVHAVPHARTVSAPRLVALLAIALPGVTAAMIVSFAVHASWPRATEIVTPPAPIVAPLPPAPPPEGLEWLAQTRFSPTLAGPEVTGEDASGARSIVGLAWDRARDVDGMYAIAFDHATLVERWRSGPYPSFRARDGESSQHLALVGDRIVVTDRVGGVHVLDPHTGEERALKKLPNAPFGACVAGAGAAARLILPLDGGWRARSPGDPNGGSLFPWEINRVTVALDPATGRTSAAAPFTACEPDHYCMWKGTNGCRALEERETAPQGNLHVSVQEVWRWGTDRVSLGPISPASSKESFSPAAVGWDATTRAVRWEARLTAPGPERAPAAVTFAALGAKTFFFLHGRVEGSWHLVALDSRTGARRFDVDVPGAALGTRVHDLSARAEDAFVALNEELLVFDGATGRLRGRLGEAR